VKLGNFLKALRLEGWYRMTSQDTTYRSRVVHHTRYEWMKLKSILGFRREFKVGDWYIPPEVIEANAKPIL